MWKSAAGISSATQVVVTAHVAILFATGQPLGQLMPAGVSNLAHHFLKGMLMTKMKLISATLLCGALSVAAIEAPTNVKGVK